jgi:uncharacterized membrane protein YbhN (UPF0104 family)
VRVAAAVATLGVVVWRLGAGPFLAGVRAVDGRALLVAMVVGALTTACCAWRWTVVARGLGVRLPLPGAIGAYYRSVFLNLTLPGGVAGDVHRGVSHGRDVNAVGRALRIVAWERTAGQVVQAAVTVAVLLVLPSPVRSFMPVVVVAVAAGGVAVLVAARLWAVLADDLRATLLQPTVALASAVVVAGHAVTFLVAARTAGVDAPLLRLLPLVLLAMLAAALPSVAGWGPREGATAWAFGAAGLGADQGAATAVAYGVMVLVASLPGALVVIAGWIPGRVVNA